MNTPATAPARAGDMPSSILIADDAGEARAAAEMLRGAGFAVHGPGAEDAALLVLILSGDAAERVVAIGVQAGARPDSALVATMPADAPVSLLRKAMRAGADGIVLDHQLESTLVATACAVLAGQIAVPRTLRRRIAPRPLSYREKEILSLVVQGFTNRQIADTLFLAESTVKTHLSSAFGKLDARSRSEAAALVLDPDAGFELGLPVVVVTPSAA
jgi:DNA-binding NarL/FixJ family response regulator